MIFFLTAMITITAFFVWRNATRNKRQDDITFGSVTGVSALVVGLVGVLTLLQFIAHSTAENAGVADFFGVVSDKTLGSDVQPENPVTTVIKYPIQMQSPVALVSKVVLDVTRKEAFKEWQTARRGETLSSGDRVKTGENSVALIKFKDNSLVRVRERSELTVTGTTKRSFFSKSVDLANGVVGFRIQKQRSDEEFRITSPTSIASIRGTGGKFISGGFSDTLTVVEGMVVLTNVISSANVEVLAGHTGISNPDGTIFVRMARPEELIAAGSAAGEDKETMQAPTVVLGGDSPTLRVDTQNK